MASEFQASTPPPLPVRVPPTGGGGLQKIHSAVLLPPIGILSIIIIGLTGSSFQKLFDPNPDVVLKGTDVSIILITFTGPAATLAIAAVLAGFWYAIGKAESWVTAASALSTALVAWAFGLVAFGFACKQPDYGGDLSGELKALSGFTILIVILETVYVGLLHVIVARSP